MTKAFRYTLVSGLVGIIAFVVTFFIERSTINHYRSDLAAITFAEGIKANLTQAVMLLQQSGTNASTATQGIESLQVTLQQLQKAYAGTDEFSKVDYLKYEETRILLKETLFDTEQLLLLAKQETIDLEKLNGQSAKLFSSANRLSNHITTVGYQQARTRTSLSWVTEAVLFLAIAFIIIQVYRWQHASDEIINNQSARLSEEGKRVETLSQFIEAVSAGNFDLQLQNEGQTDKLTTTLVSMRDKLKQNAEDDRKRNWSTTGQAQIGEILRTTTQNAIELYDNIIRFLVKYTKSNQGGLFLLNDDEENDRHLELVACYAFERKKYLQKRVEIGDGLVGQCFLEGERIYLLEVPKEYVSITSGLGGANPSSLLIVPMKVNDKIYGVIELASFSQYENYEIELVEKLAESIASTISNVKVNETTRVLLERTQQQAEEMKSQEEEIRQNMEELEATQEEMRRKQTILERELDQSQKQAEILRIQERKLVESQETLQAIVDNLPRGIFWKDKELRFMGCNRIFANVAGASSPKELVGKTDFDMAWSAQADAYRKDDLEVMRSRKAKLDIEEVNIDSNGTESWVRTSKVPIISESGEVVAILGMFEDITEYKRKESDINRKLKEREEALNELQALKHLLELKKT